MCGCGQTVNPNNPVAKWLPGHHLAIARAARKPRRPADQPCACGCGEMAKYPARFVGHHGNRGVKRGEGRYVNTQGYVMRRAPEHPAAVGGYVLEHRLVMEEMLGRPLGRHEAVHHVNHIKTDNQPENLVLIGWRDHGAEHGRPVGVPVTNATRAKLSEATRRAWAEGRRVR